jgi:hypothetical protein
VVAGIGLLFSSGLFRRISCQLPGYSELYARYEKSLKKKNKKKEKEKKKRHDEVDG